VIDAAARAQRAIACKNLLADPVIQSAFAEIEVDLTEEWKRCHTAEERENLWRAVNIMERLKVWLQSAASHDLTALRRANVTRPLG
jgi:hypothetical protein